MNAAKPVLALIFASCLQIPAFADCNGCFGTDNGLTTASFGTGAGLIISGGTALGAVENEEETLGGVLRPVFSSRTNGAIDPASLKNWTKKIHGGDEVMIAYEESTKDHKFWEGVRNKGAQKMVGNRTYGITYIEKVGGLTNDFASDVLKHGGRITEIQHLPATRVAAIEAKMGRSLKLSAGGAAGSIAFGILAVGTGYVNEHVRKGMISAPFAPDIERSATLTEGRQP